MNLKLLLLSFIIIIIISLSAQDSCAHWKTIMAGDTCSSILQVHNDIYKGAKLDLEKLKSYNPSVVINCDNLKVGDK